MDRNASKIFLPALITLALAVPVLAQGPADLIGPFSNFNIGNIYDKFGLFIDFLLYTALFVGVSKFALEKHFDSTPAVPIVIGLVLAISTSVFAYRVGFRIVNLGPYALLVGLAMLIIAVYQMFRGFGINIPNAAAMGFVIGWAVFSAAGGTFIDQIPEDSQLRTVFAFGNILWLVGLIFLLISLFKLLTAGEEPPKQEGGGEAQQRAQQQQAQQQAQQRQAQEEQAQRERARAGEQAQDGSRQAGPQGQPATMRPRTFPTMRPRSFPQFRPAPVPFPMPGGPGRPPRMPPVVMPFWVVPGAAGAGATPGGAGAIPGGGGGAPIGGGPGGGAGGGAGGGGGAAGVGGGAAGGPPPPPIAGGALPTPGFFGRVGGWFSSRFSKAKPMAAKVGNAAVVAPFKAVGAVKEAGRWAGPRAKLAYAVAAPAVAAGAATAAYAKAQYDVMKAQADPAFQRMRKYFLKLVGSGKGSLAALESDLDGLLVKINGIRSEPDAAQRATAAASLADKIDKDISYGNGSSAINRSYALVSLIRQEIDRKPFADQARADLVKGAMVIVAGEILKLRGRLKNCADLLRPDSVDEASAECQQAIVEFGRKLSPMNTTGPLAVVAAEIQREAEAPSPVAEAILRGYSYAQPRVAAAVADANARAAAFAASAPGTAAAYAASARGRAGEAFSGARAGTRTWAASTNEKAAAAMTGVSDEAAEIIHGNPMGRLRMNVNRLRGNGPGSVEACIKELDRISRDLRSVRGLDTRQDLRAKAFIPIARRISLFASEGGCLHNTFRLIRDGIGEPLGNPPLTEWEPHDLVQQAALEMQKSIKLANGHVAGAYENIRQDPVFNPAVNWSSLSYADRNRGIDDALKKIEEAKKVLEGIGEDSEPMAVMRKALFKVPATP